MIFRVSKRVTSEPGAHLNETLYEKAANAKHNGYPIYTLRICRRKKDFILSQIIPIHWPVHRPGVWFAGVVFCF